MHPLCVVRSRVAISQLIDATTPGESRSNLAPALKTPKQRRSITDTPPGRTAYSSLLRIFRSSELRPVPQLASLKLGLPTSTQFKDGLIRLWSFPSHPPMPLHSRLRFGLTRRPQADPRLPQELFLCLFGCLMFGLIFLPVTQRDILD
jgi:hypothetical protein